MNYFVTAIHTDSGKTLLSSILCVALQADYWKPVQAGVPTDSDVIRLLIENTGTIVHPEGIVLKMPASPHAAAKAENIEITLDQFTVPGTKKDLIIEGAGGCLVPLNDKNFVIDLAAKFDCHVILLSNNYLGSINHTLLTFEALRTRKLNIAGIVFNGPENIESENIILHHTKLPCLLKIRPEASITTEVVTKYARILKATWRGKLK